MSRYTPEDGVYSEHQQNSLEESIPIEKNDWIYLQCLFDEQCQQHERISQADDTPQWIKCFASMCIRVPEWDRSSQCGFNKIVEQRKFPIHGVVCVACVAHQERMLQKEDQQSESQRTCRTFNQQGELWNEAFGMMGTRGSGGHP